MRSKSDLRAQFLDIREQLAQDLVHYNSLRVVSRLRYFLSKLSIKTVLAYMPIKNEVDLSSLYKEILIDGHFSLVFPVVHKGGLLFRQVSNMSDDLSRSTYGIFEPKEGCECVSINEIDLALVPGVVFDSSGYRLGFGGGYYDRLLASVSFDTVGICFDFQIVDLLPIDSWDISMSYVLSETRYLDLKRAAD
ncbi:MAG: 5-formyltetrahydrofolate cyclo-ligase [bacterium]